MARRIRFAVLLVLLVVGTTSLIGAPEYEVSVYYYTDATYTVQCGYYHITCTGLERSGCITDFQQTIIGNACDVTTTCWVDEWGYWFCI